MLARVLAMTLCLSVTSRCSIEMTGRIEQVFGMQAFPPIPHRAVRKYGYLQKLGYFPLRFCSKLRTWKISPRQVDHVVNKAHRSRRRQRASLLTTPIRQSTSRGGCLLEVARL